MVRNLNQPSPNEKAASKELEISPEKVSLDIGFETAQGTKRDKTANEDRGSANEDMFIICDGMGGHERRDESAEIAIKTIEENVQVLRYNIQQTKEK